MTHIGPDLYASGIEWNGTRILVSHEGWRLYQAYLEDVEPPTGSVLDEPEPHYYQGIGDTPAQALEACLQDLVESVI